MKSFSESYKAAGVDITAGYAAVELMKQHVARTMTPGAIGGGGGGGGGGRGGGGGAPPPPPPPRAAGGGDGAAARRRARGGTPQRTEPPLTRTRGPLRPLENDGRQRLR